MGRNNQFDSRESRLEIESQINGIKLVTYDDLIAYGYSRALSLPSGML